MSDLATREPYVKRIAERHGLPLAEILGDSRFASVAFARHEVIAYLRSLRDKLRPRRDRYSWPEIGLLIGRDHTTCMASVRVFGIEVERGYVPEWNQAPRVVERVPDILSVPWVTG